MSSSLYVDGTVFVTRINKSMENMNNFEEEPPGRMPGCLESIYNTTNKRVPSVSLFVGTRARPFTKRQRLGLPTSEKTLEFRQKFFPNVSSTQWNDWHWQIRNRIQTLNQLEHIIQISEDERLACLSHGNNLPLSITPYYASLLDANNPFQPLRRTVVPVTSEQKRSQGEAEDPLNEENDTPVHGLVHRYPDRVLFLATDFCSTYCRYCTRSRMVGRCSKSQSLGEHWQKAMEYIEATPAIRDVLLSGGDPLTLSEEKLEWLLSRLQKIPHVEVKRIGTKVPVVLPHRITPSLVKMLKRFHPLWISIHFTHPDELTPETTKACERLADAGIPLQSQTVLLAGINDNLETLRKLFHGLVQRRVRPYYLYQCDPILGSAHFRTTVAKGLEMVKGLRGYTSGFAVPMYVIDAPGGGGKIPIVPEYVVGRDGDDLILRNYEDKIYHYVDNATSQT